MTRFRPGSVGGAAGAGIAPLVAVWAEVVGETAARHSEPVRRSRAGLVSVVCSSAAWAQELNARRDDLLERLARLQPGVEIGGLRFAVGDHVVARAADPEQPRPAPPPAPAPGPAERVAGERAAEGIEDEAVRGYIARLAAAAAAREGRGRRPD